jgi:hypothetical protein
MAFEYDVQVVKEDEQVHGFTLEQAGLLARSKIMELDGCVAIISKRICIHRKVINVIVESVESGLEVTT